MQIANDIDYGLTAHVWINDLTRALRFTDKLEVGMIWVNSENARHLHTPFGGVKDPQRQTLWGDAASKSWSKHGTQFVAVDTEEAALNATPIVAP